MTAAMRSLHIVMIDDAMGLCDDLRPWLTAAGHQVGCLPAQRAVLHTLSEQAPDLIILGIARFAREGPELYRRLRSSRALGRLPVLVVSEDNGLEHEFIDAFDFQVRPFDRERLLAALQRLRQKRLGDTAHITPQQLDQFKRLLRECSALHFNQRNQRILERGLQRRMLALHITTPDAYYAYLRNSAGNYDELNKLLQFLTVGETCFFRYRSHREALLHRVIPHLIERNQARRSLQIWSAGCSTGEEPYSLAILLLERFPQLQDWELRIIATDINKRALRQAREGIYGARSVRLVEPALLQRYFEEIDGLYRVKSIVRSMIRFDYLNLMTDRFPDPANQLCNLDLLLCRNVLIYFDLETIRQIVDRFADCLTADGYLFLGHAETMQNVSDRFERVHDHGAFFYRRKLLRPPAAAVAAAPEPRPRTAVPAASPTASSHEPAASRPFVSKSRPPGPELATPPEPALDVDQIYQAAMQAFDHERFVEADRLFDRALACQPRHPLSLIGKGLLQANQGNYAEARRLCARAIAADDLRAEAYLLRGLILDMEGELERALVEYRKVLWLDNHFVMGHYLLAKTCGRLGRPEQSARSLRNTLRCLEQSADQAMIPFSGGLSRGVFLDLVRHDLARCTPDEQPA
ncbi:MAG: CheR family methyltransferase [Desulfuromonadales bacterium]|nr:CheR family methyltransferase [Desulfuromonadales bacterium]